MTPSSMTSDTDAGQFRLAASGLGWKSPTGQVFTIRREDLRKTQWLRASRGYQLRIQLKDNTIVKFDGFDEDAFDRLKNKTKELCLKGWNWGKTEFQGNYLLFNIGQGTTKEKRDRARRRGDQLMEVRFYVPGTVQTDEGDGEEEQSAAHLFYETLKTKAELGQVAGEYVVRFQDVFSLSPRARFEVEFFQPSYECAVKLPRPDDIHVYFVIGIDPPIRQGQTRYPFLVFQFLKEEETDVTLNMEADELAKYDGKLESNYHNFTYVIVSTILRALTDKKITVPGNSYNSHHNQKGIKCSLKANEGFIYPLENYLLFLPKPVTLVPLREISSVVFSRVSNAITTSRFFDIKINTRSGVSHQFSNLNREEYTNVLSYLNTKGVTVRKDPAEELTSYAGLDEGGSSSEEEEGSRKRSRVANHEEGGDEDEDESVDEDFIAEDSDSDIPEEFDEEYDGADSSENEGAANAASDEIKQANNKQKGQHSAHLLYKIVN
ncbi:hypothetical protein BDF22DRAFT_742028 [Syncephalis plumigaleata]|nr:hypothetical protein BDF22DRAFT_742028 [Syncephalis plumigaleata]